MGHPALNQVIYFDRKAYASVGGTCRSRGRSRGLCGSCAVPVRPGDRYPGVVSQRVLLAGDGGRYGSGGGDSREFTGFFYTHRAAVDDATNARDRAECGDGGAAGCEGGAVDERPATFRRRRGRARRVSCVGRAWRRDEPYAVIAPGSTGRRRTGRASRFGQVAAGLSRRWGLRAVVVGQVAEAGMAAEIRGQEPSVSICVARARLRSWWR